MILGIGTDLTSIDRLAEVLKTHGERFIERCFGAEERERVEVSAKGNERLRSSGYAKRWAAKEACSKALGLGVRKDIYLKDMVVVNDAQGRPELVLTGGAKERLTALTPQGMTPRIHVSLADDPPMAIAFVVISASPNI
ncbi:MAG: holo-ACP synthase [Proteobacteria bacterium]|nr:holo-ACP synthase [Pseudomonadota bacterium]